jgi:replicative DNA helicase
LKPEDLIEAITKIVNAYGKQSKSSTVNQLLDWKDLLVGYNFHLAELMSDYFSNYNKCYYIRKIKIAKEKNRLIKSGEAITAAESIATAEAAQEFQNELDNEGMAERLNNLLRQSNKIVDAMTQRISVLKQEKNEP